MDKKKYYNDDYPISDYPIRDEYYEEDEEPTKKINKKEDRWVQDRLDEIIACRRVPEMKNW